MSPKVTPVTHQREAAVPQPIDHKRKFAGTEPVMPTITVRICNDFARGILERRISDAYGVRREMIEAVIRRDYSRLRREVYELRRLRAA